MLSRVLASIVCIASVVGIGIELATLLQNSMSLPSSLWVLAGYFTILTNSLIALAFGFVALRGTFPWPRLLSGLVAAIVLVGVVFALLLQGTRVLAGATAVADALLHQVAPILASVYWLLFVPKGTLRWRDPLLWALYPMAYLIYALIRGAGEGHFAYPFLDVSAKGWWSVVATSSIIAISFVAAGQLMVWLDRVLAPQPPRYEPERP